MRTETRNGPANTHWTTSLFRCAPHPNRLNVPLWLKSRGEVPLPDLALCLAAFLWGFRRQISIAARACRCCDTGHSSLNGPRRPTLAGWANAIVIIEAMRHALQLATEPTRQLRTRLMRRGLGRRCASSFRYRGVASELRVSRAMSMESDVGLAAEFGAGLRLSQFARLRRASHGTAGGTAELPIRSQFALS